MYNPGITYTGGQMWGNALARFGGDIGDALTKTDEIRKQNALNDPIVEHALAQGRISQEEYNKYHQANFTTKASIANGIMANVHDEWQRSMFAQQEQDKATERALQLQIAHMAHDPSANAFQPVFGPPPDQGDTSYGDRGLDLTPSGEPVSTQGPIVGTRDEKGHPFFFPWREVTAQNPGIDGEVNIDTTTMPGSTIITKGGSKNLKVIPNSPEVPGAVATGEGVPENTYAVGPGGKLLTIPKDARRRLNAANMPTPSPTPTPRATQIGNWLWNNTLGSTPAPAPTPPLATPAPNQTPVPTVVAPATAQKVKVLDPNGNPYMIPANRLQDYLNANWTAAPGG